VSGPRIPLARPDLGEAEQRAVAEALRSPQLALGPRLLAFEEAVAKRVGTAHAVAVNSGTSGLELALRALGIGAGDEVVTTPFSFVASANAVRLVGAEPVFVDVEDASLNLDPARIEAALTPRTRAVLVVHVFGRPAAMDEIVALARRRHLAVVEDACEALGAELHGRAVGSFGDAGVFAFYPNKQITTGEGGMVVTDRAALAGRLRSLRNQGRGPGDDWFEHRELGFSLRLPEPACALGIAQMARLTAILERREALAAAYAERLASRPELLLPTLHVPGGRISWFVYSLRLRPPLGRSHRDALYRGLAARGIAAGRYFAPIHLQPVYRGRPGCEPGAFPIAEASADRSLALPFFNRIRDSELDEVCAALAELLDAPPVTSGVVPVRGIAGRR